MYPAAGQFSLNLPLKKGVLARNRSLKSRLLAPGFNVLILSSLAAWLTSHFCGQYLLGMGQKVDFVC
jgi:hypothetical protein